MISYPSTTLDFYWVGASRADCTAAWAWVDDTPTENLNCGSAGCGMWESSQPDCAGGAQLYGSAYPTGINDLSTAAGLVSSFACEIPNPVLAGWYSGVGSATKVSVDADCDATNC